MFTILRTNFITKKRELAIAVVPYFAKNLKTDYFKMFESLVSNIKRRFSKTPDDSVHVDNKDSEKSMTALKRRLYLYKSKVLRPEPETLVPFNYCDDTALSPRAAGTAEAECAQTEIEWPVLIDNNPNILDKFTRIVTKVDVLDTKVLHRIYLINFLSGWS